MATLFLHLGLPKTGTSSVQSALQQSSDRLGRQGVHVPFGRHHRQRLAVYDLMGRRFPGDVEGDVAGSFDLLISEIRAHQAPVTVVSEELLSLARPPAIRKLISSFPDHEVHLVVSVRDLSRTICSSWQQQIYQGQSYAWPEFLAAVRDPSQGPTGAGVAFWLRQDPLTVLAPWRGHVPDERIHIVTVPKEGQPPGLLLERFATLLGAPPEALRLSRAPVNQSAGPVELETLRRLNSRLTDAGYQDQVIGPAVMARLGDRTSGRLTLPPEELPWVAERAEKIVTELRAAGFPVTGDLEELTPEAGPPATSEQPSDAELLAATERILTALATEFDQYRRRLRKARAVGSDASRAQRLSSSGRSLGYRARLTAVRLADRNRLFAWLARRYLARGSR
jgi:hypothetical protein